MSLFKSLQNSPRIISVFTHDVGFKPASSILQELRADQNPKFDIEVHTKFPTLDQLKYMQTINASLVGKQVPHLGTLLTKSSSNSVFGQDLGDSVKAGNWNSKTALWVDWEKKKMGTDAQSVEKALRPQ
ncbi:LAMI_0G14400g1_1 [Lachancea mirantina]|uniref:LAMI_0G14400g1_1 n=1 Tax=Lachancea mirantina TaxID=1230905 RepID=A0A1G4KC53_9SACH|nr:LAMI_0G14400g1_1 [Lachancea mirantina]